MSTKTVVTAALFALAGTAAHAGSFEMSFGRHAATESDHSLFTDSRGVNFAGESGSESFSRSERKHSKPVDIDWSATTLHGDREHRTPGGGMDMFEHHDEETCDLPPMPAVPEPPGYVMLMAGLGAVGFLTIRRKSRM